MPRIMKPSTPFSNGTEYEMFIDNFCARCDKGKLREDGFPEFPENGGCSTWDAMENARFDESIFPSNDIVQLCENGKVCCFHACRHFETNTLTLMQSYNKLMKGDADNV